MARIAWWAEASLCLAGHDNAVSARTVGRGRLGEVVALAMTRPAQERNRLFISCAGVESTLSWDKVAALAARPDCPVII